MEHFLLALALLAVFGAGCAFMAWQLRVFREHIGNWARLNGVVLERLDWRPLFRLKRFELFRTSNAQAVFTGVVRTSRGREVVTFRAGGYFLGPFTEKVEVVDREPLPE